MKKETKLYELNEEELKWLNDPIQSPVEKQFVEIENRRILEELVRNLKESNNDFRSV